MSKIIVILLLLVGFNAQALTGKEWSLIIGGAVLYVYVADKLIEEKTMEEVEDAVKRFCPNLRKMMLFDDQSLFDDEFKHFRGADFMLMNTPAVRPCRV